MAQRLFSFGYGIDHPQRKYRSPISVCTEPISGEAEERFCIKFVNAER